jgi:hypothetical protein
LKKTYSAEDLATVMAKITDMTSSVANKSDGVQNNMAAENISNVCEKLSQMHIAN